MILEIFTRFSALQEHPSLVNVSDTIMQVSFYVKETFDHLKTTKINVLTDNSIRADVLNIAPPQVLGKINQLVLMEDIGLIVKANIVFVGGYQIGMDKLYYTIDNGPILVYHTATNTSEVVSTLALDQTDYSNIGFGGIDMDYSNYMTSGIEDDTKPYGVDVEPHNPTLTGMYDNLKSMNV